MSRVYKQKQGPRTPSSRLLVPLVVVCALSSAVSGSLLARRMVEMRRDEGPRVELVQRGAATRYVFRSFAVTMPAGWVPDPR